MPSTQPPNLKLELADVTIVTTNSIRPFVSLSFFTNRANSAVPPPIEWAQRADILFVTVTAECKDEEHK